MLYSLTNTFEGLYDVTRSQSLLQVSVNYPVRVQVVEALGQVTAELLDGLFRQLLLLLDQLEEVPAGTVLEDDP